MAVSIAQKDPSIALAEALATYKEETGAALAPADPRRLHLQTLLLLVNQLRSLIDFAGKQALIDYVSDDNVEALGALLGISRRPVRASEYTQRFYATSGYGGAITIAAGKRVTDGTHIWEVTETVVSAVTEPHVDARVRCVVTGSASNGVSVGQIDTLFDSIPNVVSTSNTTEEVVAGRDVESLDEYRARLRAAPESTSAAGPRAAYEALALGVSDTVADAVCVGPDDGADMNGAAPSAGNVKVFILEGERDGAGVLTSVIPEPSAGLITAVQEVLEHEDNRPLCDAVTVAAPSFVDSTPSVTYYIARSRENAVAEIQQAVEDAFDAWCLWQESKIGRDLNPTELQRLLGNAGAKRLSFTSPTFTAVRKDQCVRMVYPVLTYGGIEND